MRGSERTAAEVDAADVDLVLDRVEGGCETSHWLLSPKPFATERLESLSMIPNYKCVNLILEAL